ncbi:hypothetical protein Cgig2_011673 [Carnegiea gigantea]|uniref:Aminotransferase-like plant mobile domain-containing protein n=1 Tax=Carnegiea gigantea TaxID=171969 RepID=A0A9Q1Q9B4_9CARY|nr:hypothetical protein Cgig2_011673 [Carnegiea gigantea]
MAIFSDESCNKRQYLCIRLDNKDTKETKVQIRKPITHFSKSKCPEGPPSLSSWSEENLKTGELFLLSSHPNLRKASRRISYCTMTYMSGRDRGRSFHAKENFLTRLYIGNGFLYDEVFPPSKELKSGMGRSCTHLFKAYHILRQRFDHKPTIEEWIAFCGFGRTKTFDLDEARELISSGRGFCWNSAIRHRLKATLVDNGQLSRADFAYFASIRLSYVCCRCEDSFVMEHYCPHRFSRQFGFHQDIPADIDFSILPSSKIMLRLHQACIRYGTNSHVFFPGQCPSLERKFTRRFQEWWSQMFLTSSDSHSGGSSKRKRVSSSDQNIQRNEAPSGSRPKFKIIRSQKPLRSPALETEDNTLQTKIPGVNAALPVAPISAVPIQSVPMAPEASDEVRLTLEPLYRRKLKSIIVCLLDEQGMPNVGGSKLDYGKTVFPPPDGAENIMDILDCDPSPTACMGESGDMNFKEKLAYVPLPLGSHCFPSIEHLSSLGQDFLGDDDEAESTPKVGAPQVLPTPRLSRATPDVSVFNVNAVIREVNKSGARMTGQVILDKVLRTPFERLHCLKGEFDSLYDLIHERGEVGSKLDAASHQLDTEIARYNALKAKLGEVDSRREELLKELQSLYDQKKDLCYQVTASEDSFQEAEQTVIDLKGQIDTLNAIEVIDPATKASLEKTEAYVKESFEDLKTFHWKP